MTLLTLIFRFQDLAKGLCLFWDSFSESAVLFGYLMQPLTFIVAEKQLYMPLGSMNFDLLLVTSFFEVNLDIYTTNIC